MKRTLFGILLIGVMSAGSLMAEDGRWANEGRWNRQENRVEVRHDQQRFERDRAEMRRDYHVMRHDRREFHRDNYRDYDRR